MNQFAKAIAWAATKGVVDQDCKLCISAEYLIYLYSVWSDKEQALFDELGEFLGEDALGLNLGDGEYDQVVGDVENIYARQRKSSQKEEKFSEQDLRFAEARSWGRAQGVLREDHSICLTGDELIQCWALWSDRERNWFEYLAEDENFHSLTKYLHNGDHKAVRSYLSYNAISC